MSKSFAIKAKGGKQRGVAYLTLFVLMLTAIAFGGFLLKGVTLFGDNPIGRMNDPEWYSMALVTVLCLCLYLSIVHKYLKIRFHWGWFLAVLTLVIANAVGLFLLPAAENGIGYTFSGLEFNYSWTVEMSERVRFLVGFALFGVFLYCFYAVFPKSIAGPRHLDILYVVLVLIGLVAVIYSWVKEAAIYQSFFDREVETISDAIVSFTDNPNTLAFGLLGASFLCCYLNSRRHSLIWYLVLALFTVQQILIGSRTSLVLQGVLVLAYPIHRFALTVKGHPGRNIPVFILYLIAGITLLVLLLVNPFEPTSFLGKIGNRLHNDYFGSDVGQLSNRLRIYSRILGMIGENPMRLVFGVGDQQALYYLAARSFPEYAAAPVQFYAHNGFLQNLLCGGIVRVGFLLLVSVVFVMKAIELIAKKQRVGFPLLLGWLLMVGHGLMESTSFVASDSRGFALYLILTLPLLSHHHLLDNKALSSYKEASKADARKVFYAYEASPVRTGVSFMAVFTFLIVWVLGCLPVYAEIGKVDFDLPRVLAIMLGGAYLLFPLAISFISTKEEAFAAKLYGSLLFLAFGALVAVPLFLRQIAWLPWASVGGMALLTLLCVLTNLKGFKGHYGEIFPHLYLPFVPLALIGIGIGIGSRFVPVGLLTHQFALSSAATGAFLILFVYSWPCYKKLLFPANLMGLHLDCRLMARSYINEEKLQKREDIGIHGKPHWTEPPSHNRYYVHM